MVLGRWRRPIKDHAARVACDAIGAAEPTTNILDALSSIEMASDCAAASGSVGTGFGKDWLGARRGTFAPPAIGLDNAR